MTNRFSRREMLRMTSVGVAAAAVASPSILRAQDGYPDRPLNVVVPFDTGGYNDRLARAFAPFLQEQLGQPLNIANALGVGLETDIRSVSVHNPQLQQGLPQIDADVDKNTVIARQQCLKQIQLPALGLAAKLIEHTQAGPLDNGDADRLATRTGAQTKGDPTQKRLGRAAKHRFKIHG